MPSTWIDFHALREQLDLADVLEHYGVSIKRLRGDQLSCLCPLPDHPIRHEPGKRTASFSGNVRKGVWQCFGCGASGNCIDLAVLMEGKDPQDREAVREVALHLAETFDLQFDRPQQQQQRRLHHQERPDRPQFRRNGRRPTTTKKAMDAETSTAFRDRAKESSAQCTLRAHERILPTSVREDEKSDTAMLPGNELPVVVNPPLGFELQHLDPAHPYLASRGLSPATVAHFGLGHCSRGMLTDRIAIPLHDPQGTLVGYGGRIVNDNLISDDVPKYLFPGTREREGMRVEFRKSLLLYNAHRIAKPVDDLIVVEGFASVWHLHQLGHVNVVALMGSSCSSEQARIIADLVHDGGRIWLMPDGDQAGEQCATNSLHHLASERFCRWVRLKDGQQPTDLDENAVTVLMSIAVMA
jgi:DNA primase